MLFFEFIEYDKCQITDVGLRWALFPPHCLERNDWEESPAARPNLRTRGGRRLLPLVEVKRPPLWLPEMETVADGCTPPAPNRSTAV